MTCASACLAPERGARAAERPYDTVVSKAKGLGPKTGSKITWRWRVGTSTHPGSWPIIVRCGESGTLRTKIRVLPR